MLLLGEKPLLLERPYSKVSRECSAKDTWSMEPRKSVMLLFKLSRTLTEALRLRIIEGGLLNLPSSSTIKVGKMSSLLGID